MTRKKRRLTLVLVGMSCLGVAAALALSAFSDNLVFFYSPSDIAQKQPAAGRSMRIGGLVEDHSVTRTEGGKEITFKVTDGSHDLTVTYVGVPPDLFREGQGVIAEGKLDQGGVFVAASILAKHDERYMPKEVVDALKQSGQWRGDNPAASASAAPAVQAKGRLMTTLSIAELGHYALILALAVALVQAVLPMWGATRGDRALMAMAPNAALLQFGCVAIAMAALAHAYITSDFSVAMVIENSNSAKPMLYKITGVWGNHEGSMLLWVFILTGYGAAVALFGGNLPPALRARVLSIHGMIGVGFLLFILVTSNPFLRIDQPPPDGQGMNPLLQDPGLAFHPPFLYLGYVGFSMAFSFAVAALIEGKVDAAWARWVRPWTLAAWCALTLGIALGSWWAYYELGWGGWWAWDPVENASFMPWLSGTALLHSAIVVEKRDTLKTWTIFLALLTFALSLLGTFLVRSGVLASVHAFATDPRRGAFILLLLGLVIGGSLLLYAVRAPTLRATGSFAVISREGALVLNNLLLSTACLTVFLGTLLPLFLDAVGGPKVSIGAPYYAATFMPLMMPMLVAVAIGPFLTWRRADLLPALAKLKVAFGVTLAVAIATGFITQGKSFLAPLGLGVAAWIFAGTVAECMSRIRPFQRGAAIRAARQPRAAWGMTLAHAGLAIVVAGITVSSGWKQEGIQVLKPGQSMVVAGETYLLMGVKSIEGPDYSADQATVSVTGNGSLIAIMTPMQKHYPLQRQTVADVAIHTNFMSDRYVVIGEKQPEGGWLMRIYWNPLVPWIWLGAVLMAIGGLVSLTDRRLRIGVPIRRRASSGKGSHVPA